jgi:hypothetical protein
MPSKSLAKTALEWRRSPATPSQPNGVQDFIERSNRYFEGCHDNEIRPTLTGYALAVGLPGPTSLIRLGQRMPELRYTISRCMTAIATAYEEMIGFGNATGPLFMLKNIPDFDPDEPIGSPPVQFFNEKKEIILNANIAGVARTDSEYDEEDPVDTYARLIRQRDVTPQISSNQKNTRNPYRVLTIINGDLDEN